MCGYELWVCVCFSMCISSFTLKITQRGTYFFTITYFNTILNIRSLRSNKMKQPTQVNWHIGEPDILTHCPISPLWS